MAGMVLALAGCGAAGTPTTSPSAAASAAASVAASASAEPSAAAAPSAPASASAVASTAPTAAASADGSPTAVPTDAAAASDAPEVIEAAVVRPDKSIVLINGTAEQPIGKLDGESISNDVVWSPDGHRLALDGGVFTFGVDTTVPPAQAPIFGSSFHWSADGSRLAWVAGVEEHLDVIRVGGPDGYDANVIGGSHWAYTGRVAWSPAGDTVLSGRLEASTDGSGYRIVEERGKNPIWSPTEDTIAYTTADVASGTGTITVTVERAGGAATAFGTISIPMPGAEGVPPELESPPIQWLPDGSGVLVPLPSEPLTSGAGTYLVRGGTSTLVSPHTMVDLAPDGTRMLARTAEGHIVVVQLADGSVAGDMGLGLDAAWRPAHDGIPPTAPLAERSPTLALATPLTTGDAVRELQQRLTDQGFSVGTVDGVFGAQTEAAVRTFQEAQGLTVDGIAGPQTWAALRFDAEGAIREYQALPK